MNSNAYIKSYYKLGVPVFLLMYDDYDHQMSTTRLLLALKSSLFAITQRETVYIDAARLRHKPHNIIVTKSTYNMYVPKLTKAKLRWAKGRKRGRNVQT